jgi:uncharacterized protein YdeI (BOF family)
MDSIGAVVAAILLAMMLVGGAAVAQISYNESAEQEQTFTETFDAGAAGTIVTFNESNMGNLYYYDDTVTVVTKNNKELVDGDDYEWFDENGTLKVLDGDLDNTTDNEITYSLREPTEQQTEIAENVAVIFGSAQWLPLVLVFLLVLLAVGALGGLT